MDKKKKRTSMKEAKRTSKKASTKKGTAKKSSEKRGKSKKQEQKAQTTAELSPLFRTAMDNAMSGFGTDSSEDPWTALYKIARRWVDAAAVCVENKLEMPVLAASTTDAKTVDFFKKAFPPRPPLTKTKPVKKRSKKHDELLKLLMAQGQTLEAGHAVGLDEPALVQVVGVFYEKDDNNDKFLSVLAVECSPCKLTLTVDHLQHPVCDLKLSPDEYTQLMQRFGGDDSDGEEQREGEAEAQIQHETPSTETDAKEPEMETEAESEPQIEEKSKAKEKGRKRKPDDAPEPTAKKAKAKTTHKAKSKRKENEDAHTEAAAVEPKPQVVKVLQAVGLDAQGRLAFSRESWRTNVASSSSQAAVSTSDGDD